MCSFPDLVVESRGVGLMRGVRLEDPRGERSGGEVASGIVAASLRAGVILLSEGPAADLLAVTPPLSIGRGCLEAALEVIEEQLRRVHAGAVHPMA